MSFEQNIQHWVKLDNQSKQLNEQMRLIRQTKNELIGNINTYVEDKNLKNCIVEISDGRLKFTQSQITQSLTLGFIKDCLSEIINDQEQVNVILNHIKERRATRINSGIKRYYN
mgnify:CR=1 FL=1|jgi:hypothetical protein